MLIQIPDVLTGDEVAKIRAILEAATWVDGKVTAGDQAAQAKFNLQIPENTPAAREAGEVILRALGRNAIFNSAALPFRVLPPMFNRYDTGMKFDAHVDGAIRAIPGAGIRMRADVSSTLFLTPPEDYDGGELVIKDSYGVHEVKLPPGHMVLYPATSLHNVNEITRGSRWSSFFWTQSIVKDDAERALLYDLDVGIIETRRLLKGDTHSTLLLANVYHNLLRRWAEL